MRLGPRSVAPPLALVLVLTLLLSGCSADGDGAGDPDNDTGKPPTAAQRLDLQPGWGPSKAELERAARYVTKMSLSRLAGQVIVADWTGTEAPLRLVRRHQLGGVVAFSDNLVDPAQARRVNRTLQRGVRRPWPLLIGVDQEGGDVARLQGGATRFPSLMSVGAADDEQLTRQVHRAAGGELRRAGFTVDFAPIADVTVGPADRTIAARSVSSDPQVVARHVIAAAQGLGEGGVVPVVKHFPGHGSVTADSHLTLPVQQRTRKQLEQVDWVPFEESVAAGLPAVMVGHLDVRAIDQAVPSSLSRPLVTGVLRKDLGFDGLVVTDALNMAAVTRSYAPARAAVSALQAGADVLLMPADPGAARAGITKAVRTGRLAKSRLRQAAARQIALLLHHRATAGPGRTPGTSWAVSRRLSARALTSVAGPCTGEIAPSRPIPFGDPTAVANFRRAAAAAGLALGEVDYVKPPPPQRPSPPPAAPPSNGKKGKRGKQRENPADRAARKQYEKQLQLYTKEFARWQKIAPTPVLRGTRIDLVGSGSPAASSDYVVAVDTPYVLGQTAARVRIATYGDTIGAMTALVAFLQGRTDAPGQLPVPVGGVREGC